MKVAIAFALLAACFAVSTSSPAPRAVDWSAVDAIITEIEKFCDAFQGILGVIRNTNEQVGTAISGKVYDACARSNTIFEQVKAAIAYQSLTEEKAKERLGETKDILAGIMSDIHDELPKLSQLSPSLAQQFQDILDINSAYYEQKLQEIYALLRA